MHVYLASKEDGSIAPVLDGLRSLGATVIFREEMTVAQLSEKPICTAVFSGDERIHFPSRYLRVIGDTERNRDNPPPMPAWAKECASQVAVRVSMLSQRSGNLGEAIRQLHMRSGWKPPKQKRSRSSGWHQRRRGDHPRSYAFS